MPPINQQGSRAGLITTLVVFAVLFIVSSVFAFQFYGKWQNELANYAQFKKSYTDIAPLAAMNQPVIQALKTAKEEPQPKLGVTPSDSYLDVAIHQRDYLAGLIRGQGTTSDNPAALAADDTASTLKQAQGDLKSANVDLTLPTTGLNPAIKTMTATLVSYHGTIAQLTSQLNDTTAKLKAAEDATAAANQAKDQQLDNVRKADADALASANKAVDAVKASIAQMQSSVDDGAKQTLAQMAQKDSDVNDLKRQLADLEKQIIQYKARLGAHRPTVESTVIRQSDGKLVRVASNGICYINLGYGDQVTPGLTFEVYDKSEGVPGLPENAGPDDQLPVGKGSIEITHVGTTSSECRIIKTTPGAILGEGDLIANLVYDPHTKYNFFVYGNFDLAENGRPNAPDAEVIKRLITQWGGKLADKIDPSTDFVVLGAEPVVPNFAKEEITAENQKKIDDAQARLAEYQDFENQAKDLHIPILNQNRFLYYVGFYDQAKR